MYNSDSLTVCVSHNSVIDVHELTAHVETVDNSENVQNSDGDISDGNVIGSGSATEETSDGCNGNIVQNRGSRKRKRKPENWAKNFRKQRTQHGESYTSVRGTEIAAKLTQPKPCNCQIKNGFRCSEVSEEDRVQLCHTYWHLAD